MSDLFAAVSGVMQQLPEARLSWRYGAEALFFLGIAYGLMRWVLRVLRENIEATAEREQSFLVRAVGGAAGAGSGALEARKEASTVRVFCPRCGVALTPEPYPLPFVTHCPSCACRVHVRGDGTSRLSLVTDRPKTAK